MSSLTPEYRYKNTGRIVPEFESAKQTSREERLEFLASRIIDNDARRQAEIAVEATKRRLASLDARVARAETAYIDRHMKVEPAYELTPYGDAHDYSDKIKALRERFHDRPQTDRLKQQVASVRDNSLTALEKIIQQQHEYERTHQISRDEFFRMRSSTQISDVFNRGSPR